MVPNLKQLADAMGGIYIEGEASPIVAEDVYAQLIESDTYAVRNTAVNYTN